MEILPSNNSNDVIFNIIMEIATATILKMKKKH